MLRTNVMNLMWDAMACKYVLKITGAMKEIMLQNINRFHLYSIGDLALLAKFWRTLNATTTG